MSIAKIAKRLGMRHQNVSRHLKRMEHDKLVSYEIQGREKLYFLRYHTAVHIRLHPQLSDSQKLRIAELLASDPKKTWNLNMLTSHVDYCFVTVHRFLKILGERGLVVIEKTETRYRVKATAKLVSILKDYREFVTNFEDRKMVGASPVIRIEAGTGNLALGQDPPQIVEATFRKGKADSGSV